MISTYTGDLSHKNKTKQKTKQNALLLFEDWKFTCVSLIKKKKKGRINVWIGRRGNKEKKQTYFLIPGPAMTLSMGTRSSA